MDYTNLVWALVGAALGAAVQLLIDRIRHTHEDYELWCDVLPWGTVSEHGLDESSGAPVIDLLLWNAGRRDITAADFDRGRSFVVHLGARILWVYPVGQALETDDGLVKIYPEGAIEVTPGLLRAGMAVHLRLATTTFPSLSFDNPIAHVGRIRSALDLPPHRLSARTRGVLGWIVVAVFVILGGMCLSLFRGALPWLPFPAEVQYAGAGVFAGLLLISILLVFYRLSRGPHRALFLLHEALGEETVEIGMSRRRWWEGRVLGERGPADSETEPR
jgi:hypothetical protein